MTGAAAGERSARVRRVDRAYLVLLTAGVVLPYARALPWLAQHGPDARAFLDEAFGTRIAAFFGWDVVVTASTLITVAALDDELSTGQRGAVAAGALGGPSVGLPLYLFLREHRRRARTSRPTRR